MSELLHMTELDAVNSMLSAVGELPINTLEEANMVTLASTARNTLQRESRNIQSMGLNCNHEEDFQLLRDEEGKIQVPSNTLNVDPMDPNKTYVLRGGYLYDKEEHTYIFEDDVKVALVLFIPFDDLPNHVQVYITALAKKAFQKDYIGSETLDKMARTEVFEAQVMFRRMEERNKDVTMLASPAVYRALRKRKRWR